MPTSGNRFGTRQRTLCRRERSRAKANSLTSGPLSLLIGAASGAENRRRLFCMQHDRYGEG